MRWLHSGSDFMVVRCIDAPPVSALAIISPTALVVAGPGHVSLLTEEGLSTLATVRVAISFRY